MNSLRATGPSWETKLQNIGFDILSSIHWVVFVVIAVIFAGVVVFINHSKKAQQSREQKEAEAIIENGRKQTQQYFNADGTLNKNVFPDPSMLLQRRESQGSDDSDSSSYVVDDLNRRIRRKHSSKALAQVQRLARSGQLFSFVNSALTTPDRLAERMRKRQQKDQQTTLTEEEKLKRRLRAQYGANRMRNPLIDLQVRQEIERRKRETRAMAEPQTNELHNVDEETVAQMDDMFEAAVSEDKC